MEDDRQTRIERVMFHEKYGVWPSTPRTMTAMNMGGWEECTECEGMNTGPIAAESDGPDSPVYVEYECYNCPNRFSKRYE